VIDATEAGAGLPGALAAPGVRVLLAGTGNHLPGSALPAVEAVGPTLAAVGDVLADRCGVRQASMRTVADPVDPLVLGTALAEAAEHATDVLLFYYVGHGLVSADGELHLATFATGDISRGLAYRALPFSAVRDALNGCAARAIVIVLDCCFGGRAGGPIGAQSDDGFATAQVRGTYLLAAAAHDEQALAPAGERLTAFSGALVDLLREGDPRGPRSLTLGHTYRYLSQALPARGLPRPRRHAGGLADDLVLAPNAAYQHPVPAPAPPASAEQRSPYLGLAAFGPGDARFFFGRDHLTAELAGRLAEAATDRPGPLVVIGPSGSGKSSMLRAGLLAALDRGAVAVPGSTGWPRVIVTPGEAPLHRLAAALSPAAALPAGELAGRLREDPSSLAAVLRAIVAGRAAKGGDRGDRVVLLVDQFEELFALGTDEGERRACIDALCAACTPQGGDAPGPAGLVVLAVRADFYGRCLAYPALVRALRDRHVLVGPMSEAELRDAIEKPADACGLALQPGLTDLLLRDLGTGDAARPDEATTLPLLSYALLTTWQRREGRELTMAGYQAAGGIQGAVAQEAERLYLGLSPAGQDAVRAILLAMVRIGDGTADTRRRADLEDLKDRRPEGEAGDFARARDELAAARLITLRAGGADITHEALLRAWPRLHGWIEENRAGLLAHQRLGDAAATWHRAGRDPAALYRGTLLAAAQQWAGGHGADLSPLERDFLGASAGLAHSEEQATRGRARRRRQVAGVLAALAGVAVATTLFAVGWHRRAVAESLVAQSRRDAATALSVRASDPGRAALLALAGWQSGHSAMTRGSLLSVQMDEYSGTLVRGHLVPAAAISPDGRLIATAGYQDKTIRLWDARTRREITAFRLDGHANAVAFSPDGRTLAGGVSSLRAVRLWDVRTHRLIRVLPGPGASALAFSPDGRLLAVGEGVAGTGRTVHLWNPATGTEVATLPGDALAALSLAFSPGGHLLAAGVVGGPARHPRGATLVWEVPGDTLLATLPRPGSSQVRSVAFSPDGRLLASTGLDTGITIWDTASHRMRASLDSGRISGAVAFTPDGLDLITSDSDGALRLLDVASRTIASVPFSYEGNVLSLAAGGDGHMFVVAGTAGAYVLTLRDYSLPSPRALTGVAFSPGGGMIATSGTDGEVRLWDSGTRWQARALAAHRGSALSVAFGPGGRVLASAGTDGYLRLWNPATGDLLAALRLPSHGDQQVAFSPDGSMLAAASLAAVAGDPSSVRVWDARSRRLLAATRSGDLLTTPAFSPDGTLLAYGVTAAGNSGASHVVFAAARSLRPAATTAQVPSQLLDLAFSPDGRTLAASYASGKAMLWDVRTHRLIETITATGGQARSIAFSPDGQTIAVGSTSTEVQLFDVRTGGQIAELDGHADLVRDLAFSPDGHTLASVSGDGRAYLWNIDPGRAVRRLCQAVAGPGFARQWAALHAGPSPCVS
jgi:WD40 repeat protein